MTATEPTIASPTPPVRARPGAVRRPIATFLAFAFGIGLPLLTVPAVTGLPEAPFLLVTVYVGLAGSALLLTRWTGGRPAVRALLSGVLRWRFGVSRWIMLIAALPLLTVGIAAASGTLRTPDGGWTRTAIIYLVSVVVTGALLFNVWEELGWMGFVQSRLMQRRGLLVGSLLTAPLFVAIHLPLLFLPGWTWTGAGISIAALVVAAPFFRYVLGTQWVDTGGSLLAVGLLHASWNASGALDVMVGGWQHIAAMIVLTLVVAVLRRRRASTVV
jgi:membrane protease YdiL (CAAX protease family)